MESQRADRAVRGTLWVVLALNLSVAVAKLTVGALVSSLSMVADGFHSLTDSASNVVGLVGIGVARRPPDEDHPYGHRRFETLAALLIGGLLTVTAFEVLKGCVERLWSDVVPRASPLAFAVMLATMAVNFVVSFVEHRRGVRLGSEILRADAAHTRSDVYASLAVLASLVAARLGFPQLDLVAALAITVVIGRTAFAILKENGMMLTDAALFPAERLRSLALEVPGVESVHKIRSRSGPKGGYADLHVQTRADLRLDEAHVIAHLVSDRLRRELGLAEVLVHVEPPEGHQTSWRPAEVAAPEDSVRDRAG